MAIPAQNDSATELLNAINGKKSEIEFEERTSSSEKDIEKKSKNSVRDEYKKNSVRQMVKIIKTQASAIEASKPLIFSGTELDATVALTIWETDNKFILQRILIAEKVAIEGQRFLGFRTNQYTNEVVPFNAKTTGSVFYDPLYSFINQIEYVTDSYIFENKNFALCEKYAFEYSTGKYVFKRYSYEIKNGKISDSVIKNEKLPKQYQLTSVDENGKVATVEYMEKSEIDGVLILNRASGEPDFENVRQLTEDRGKIFYEIGDKIHKLSPKVLYKTTIAGKKISERIEREFEENTFIGLETRASQFQAPFAIFDPSRQLVDLRSTIDMYEDEILWACLCNSPMGSGKKAQENDLGTSLNNQTAGDYAEQKKNIRSIQFTEYFKKVGRKLGLEVDSLVVEVELSTTQSRVIGSDNNDDDDDEKTTFENGVK